MAATLRIRRTDEQLIADLKAKILDLKQRADQRKARSTPGLRDISAALRSIDKAEAGPKDPMLHEARARIVEHPVERSGIVVRDEDLLESGGVQPRVHFDFSASCEGFVSNPRSAVRKLGLRLRSGGNPADVASLESVSSSAVLAGNGVLRAPLGD